MEKQEVEKCPSVEDAGHLNRNRSFKTKQLVRSQAIREAASPPRSVSPPVCERDSPPPPAAPLTHADDKKQPVEIQITQGSWQCESAAYVCREAAGRGEESRDLLSYSPRVACVCGACAPCPHCRGRRRRLVGSIHKQDSGIADCADCGTNGVGVDMRKASSLDAEEYCRCPERRDKPRHTFSRTDSEEPTGAELVSFIADTLNKSAKDRAALFKIEKELHALVNDAGRCIVKFPVMTSYGRMLVHRCAALFQLSHHPDQCNKHCVIVSKAGTSGGRIPCTSFKAWCVTSFPPASPARAPDPAPLPHQAKSILKRSCLGAAGRGAGALAARSKSLEQREQDYERARRRIFSQDKPASSEESPWPWLSAGPVKLLTPDHARNKLLKVQSLESASPPGGSWRARGPAVAKSHSFGGYTDPQPHARALSRQGDLASSSWRLSPSSSGYKTLSLRSTDSVTPSPTGGGTPEAGSPAPGAPAAGPSAGGAVLWAVSDMARVPSGVTLIHPQTGRPLTNADGSLYRFDPDNPPHVCAPHAHPAHPATHQTEAAAGARRGRLQKQHSFLQHETECAASEPCGCGGQAGERGAEGEVIQFQESSPAQFPAPPAAGAPPEPSPAPAPQLYQGTVYYSPQLYAQPHYEQEVQCGGPQQYEALGKTPALLEHNLRNMVVSSNVVFGAGALPPAYHYAPHASCLETAALYGAGTPAPAPEDPQAASPPAHTFRIDASYPYPPLEYSSYGEPVAPALGPAPAALGAPAPVLPLQQRSYSVGYGGELAPAAPYPVGGVYGVPWTLPYGPPLLSGPPARPSPAPLLYPHHYNTILYPQMVPQYQVCAPVFTTAGPRAATPPSAELRGGPAGSPPQGPPAYRSVRNNGHGILGRYPQYTGQCGGAGGGAGARVLLDSLRQLQTRSTYQSQERRPEPRERPDRPDRRPDGPDRRPDGRGDGQTDRHAHKHSDRQHYQHDRNNYNQDNHYNQRNSNYQDKNNVHDRNNHVQDRNNNAQERNNVQDRSHSDRNVPDKTQDRSNVQDRNSYQERSYKNYQQTNQQCLNNAQNNRDNNAKDIYQEKSEKEEIFTGSTMKKMQVQSNAQESINDVQGTCQNTKDRGDALDTPVVNTQDKITGNTQDKITGNTQDRPVGNSQDRTDNTQERTVGNAADMSNAQEGTVVERKSTQEKQSHQERGWSRAGPPPPARRATPAPHHYRPHYLFRQVSAGAWCRRAPASASAPAPLHPGLPGPRRPLPDARSGRRY